jgi:hypothetical protein
MDRFYDIMADWTLICPTSDDANVAAKQGDGLGFSASTYENVPRSGQGRQVILVIPDSPEGIVLGNSFADSWKRSGATVRRWMLSGLGSKYPTLKEWCAAYRFTVTMMTDQPWERDVGFKASANGTGVHSGEDDDESEPVAVTLWPDPPDDTAYSGLLGQIARTIEPHTEWDPLALLAHLVVSFGNVIGRSAYIQVEATRHHLNEYAVNVGRSAMGRKGTAADWAREVYNRVDGVWATDRIQAGLSSAEGLISAVRDPLEIRSPIRQKGKIVDWQMVVTDAGITDKRLLVLETEFGGVLRALQREGNKLSALIRLGWDSGLLQSLTKIPHKASDAHISILGHITINELRHLLSCVDIVNGFANRFLWFAVRRQRSLPFGGAVPDLKTLADSLSIVVEHARTVGRIGWTDDARDLWPTMYDELADLVPPGPLGEVLSRCHPHVLRLAGIYTLADGLAAIGRNHLSAARALWDASARCARYIFGDSLGDPNAEKIMSALKVVAPGGLTRKEIREGVFQRNLPASKIKAALALLIERGMVREVKETSTGGRPAHRYFASTPTP